MKYLGSISDSKDLVNKGYVDNLIAPAYSSSSAYSIGQGVIYNNKLYKCNTAIPSPGETWTSAHWTEVKMANTMDDVSDLKSDFEAKVPISKSTISNWKMHWTISSTGVENINTATAITDGYIPVAKGTYIKNLSDAVGMNGKNTIFHVAQYGNSGFISRTQLQVGESLKTGDSTTTIRFLFGYPSVSGNTETSEDLALHFKVYIISDKTLVQTFYPTEVGMVLNDGKMNNSEGYHRTGFIPVIDGLTYCYTGKIYRYATGAAYDENYQFLSALFPNGGEGTNYNGYIVTIPEGAAYVAFCSLDAKTLEVYTIADVTTEIVGLHQYDDALTKRIEQLKSGLKKYELTSVSMFETIGVCGDSYSSGGIYGVTGVPGGAHYGVSWEMIMGRKNGINCYAYSTPGANTASWQTNAHCLPLLLSEPARNLYIIMLGINSEGTIGSTSDINDEDPSQNANSMYGRYAQIYHAIHNHAPNAKMIFVRPPMITSEKNTCIKTLATRYGVPTFDLTDDPFIKTSFYINNLSESHPIAVTYAGMALAFERQIANCMVDNISYFADYIGND